MLGGGRDLRGVSASRPVSFNQIDQSNVIDYWLFKAMQENGITPASKSNDYEFLRRVYYDLSGRPPTLEKLAEFVNNSDPAKRAKLVDDLIGSPEFIDKWTMFFGDHFKNVDNNGQINRFAEGRQAFYSYLKDAVTTNKKYDVMAREMITALGDNNWDHGTLNFILGGFMQGGPAQDTYDLLAQTVAEKFLGIAHENCLLCHDGRRHLDSLSVWGKAETRMGAYQLASFFSKLTVPFPRTYPNPDNRNVYKSVVGENPRNADYPLGSTTGNRSPRTIAGSVRNVAPAYPFGTNPKPAANENYRTALARFVTSDIQFARAAVNYIFKQFFVRGIVDPPNQFDLARLDPTNPPPDPWTLQPTNPYLLDALAKDFQQNKFDIRDLIRKIVLSDAYQLSAQYDGEWKPEYEKYFARKFVRRLWGEEIVDTLVQTSNVRNNFTFTMQTPLVQGMQVQAGIVPFSMQLPQTRGQGGGAMVSFLDSFLRGNRIDEDRKDEGSVPQVLNLLNDSFVHVRTRATGSGASATIARRLLDKYTGSNNNLLINELFLTLLNRPATDDEVLTATIALNQAVSIPLRQAKVEDLVWSAFNKVDFAFNY